MIVALVAIRWTGGRPGLRMPRRSNRLERVPEGGRLPAGSLAATEVDAAAKEISRIAATGFIGLLLCRILSSLPAPCRPYHAPVVKSGPVSSIIGGA
jgi:hypothetical protein